MAKNEGGSQNWNSRFVPPIRRPSPNYPVILFLGPPLRRRLELSCVHAGVITPRLNGSTGVSRGPHQFPGSPNQPYDLLAARFLKPPGALVVVRFPSDPLTLCRPFHNTEATDCPRPNHKTSVSSKAAPQFSISINLVFLNLFPLSSLPQERN